MQWYGKDMIATIKLQVREGKDGKYIVVMVNSNCQTLMSRNYKDSLPWQRISVPAHLISLVCYLRDSFTLIVLCSHI